MAASCCARTRSMSSGLERRVANDVGEQVQAACEVRRDHASSTAVRSRPALVVQRGAEAFTGLGDLHRVEPLRALVEQRQRQLLRAERRIRVGGDAGVELTATWVSGTVFDCA